MEQKWYEKTYRRVFLDFHIDDWDKKFLSQFDPEQFADCVTLAKGATATVMANTHTGLCNYPTKVGEMHAGLKGRDALGEMIDRCHERGINVVIYYCTIYVDWYWDNHPEARIVDAEGKSEKLLMSSAGHPRRFSVCCMNNPDYREFVMAQLGEICDNYHFEGVWPDMAFWPTVCYCPSCQERYKKEVGGQIPRVINWEDPAWVRFQRKRQEWLLQFVHLVTSAIKNKKPEASVAHQSLTFCRDWLPGPSAELAKEMDWLSTDLYGGRYTLSFYSKLLYSMSEKKPFEHLNTWCYPGIFEHVITRTEDQLRANAFSALINHGAMIFIDAIDPIGTVHKNNYITVGKVFGEVEKYEEYVGGKYCQDVGIYSSFYSNFDLEENGREVVSAGYNFEPGKKPASLSAHRNAAVNMAKTLIQYHIPFGVVTKKTLKSLSDYQVIVLPNVVMLDDEEMEALRAYVDGGGGLYASKNTSIITKDGVRRENFLLSDLFGVSYVGETKEIVTYVAPEEEWSSRFPSFSANLPVTLYDTQLKVKVNQGAEVLATITLPYTDPTETRYASILTDPPGIETEYPSIVLNQYGKGKVLYAAGVLETWQHDSQRIVLLNLLKLLGTRPFYFETDAPKSVEITLFQQEDNRRYIINLLNFQQELPNIPIYGIRVKLWMDKKIPRRLVTLPEEEKIDYEVKGDHVEFVIPKLETFLMLELDYGDSDDVD